MRKAFLLFTMVAIFSCGKPLEKTGLVSNVDTCKVQNNLPQPIESADILPKEMWRIVHPSITGDFDGDKNIDSLYTYLYSKRDKKMIREIESNCEMGCICEYDPVLSIRSTNRLIPSLNLGEHTCQIYGISKLRNIGDINDDGKDEMAVIVNWADYSSLNTCDIYSLCDGKWKIIFDFSIHEGAIFYSEKEKNPDYLGDYFKQKDSIYYYNELEPAGSVWKKLKKTPICE